MPAWLANRTHQAGPYLPRDFLFEVFPEIDRSDATNPDLYFHVYIDSHADHRRARAVWYNQKTRNEARITRFGGSTSLASAVQPPDERPEHACTSPTPSLVRRRCPLFFPAPVCVSNCPCVCI